VPSDPVEGFSLKALRQWAERALTPGPQVTTDGVLGFEALGQLGHTHRVVLAPRGKAGYRDPAVSLAQHRARQREDGAQWYLPYV